MNSSYFDTLTHSNYLGKFNIVEKISFLKRTNGVNEFKVSYLNGILNVSGTSEFKVFNTYGKLILSKKCAENFSMVLGINPGIYFVKTIGNFGIKINKLLVK